MASICLPLWFRRIGISRYKQTIDGERTRRVTAAHPQRSLQQSQSNLGCSRLSGSVRVLIGSSHGRHDLLLNPEHLQQTPDWCHFVPVTASL
jgi:hypothetical protein